MSSCTDFSFFLTHSLRNFSVNQLFLVFFSCLRSRNSPAARMQQQLKVKLAQILVAATTFFLFLREEEEEEKSNKF